MAESNGTFSIARVARAWYVACASRELELGAKPLARTILNTPLILFRRPDGKPAALLDRCAHRNAPLSLGRTVAGEIECAYHGWRYNDAGVCVKVPGLLGEADKTTRAVPRFQTREQDGFVWLYAEPDAQPCGAPYRLPPVVNGYTEVRRTVEVESTLYAALEN